MARVLSVCSFAALLAVSAAGSCDGKDFACNHTDNKFIINHVYMESDTKVHWKAGDTVHIKMSGKVHNFDVTAGTLHFKIWEFGVEHFRTAGAVDYFHCGPPPKPCNKAHGKALHLANPKSLVSDFIMNAAIKLPEKMASGTMTIDIWGEDQDHQPYDFTSEIRMSYKSALDTVPTAIRATCDGADFKCNHTDTKLAITNVEVVASSGVHWKAKDTITITMQGHLKGHEITAGTLHYKIWEFGVAHFRSAGALDYFHCGPPPKPCDKTKGKALHLTKPSSVNSGFTMRIRIPLPVKMSSGTMSIDLWGEDQDHEPYDFTSEIRLSYKSAFRANRLSYQMPTAIRAVPSSIRAVPTAIRAACDGPDFKCNHTDTELAITSVEVVSTSGVHWKANDTITITMQGHLKGHEITAGTLHYKIWEFGVEHFRSAGGLDYFYCGPPPKPCNKTKGKALHLTKPSSVNSGFTMGIRIPLPAKMSSGTMTIDLWGEDQDHEPYDFTSSIRLSYKSPQPPPTPHPAGACKPNAEGCCDFSGTWYNHLDKEFKYEFTQATGSCNVSMPHCHGGSHGYATASGDTLTACPNFYDGLRGTLTLATRTFNHTLEDLIKWANGAGWSREHANHTLIL